LRRTLQELRDLGELAFDRKRPGHYTQTPPKKKARVDVIAESLAPSFEVTARQYHRAGVPGGITAARPLDVFIFRVEQHPGQDLDSMLATIEQATLALGEWYTGETSLRMRASTVNSKTGDRLQDQYFPVSRATPQGVAGRLPYAVDEWRTRKQRYQIGNEIFEVSWIVAADSDQEMGDIERSDLLLDEEDSE
jgi:hypothetical protein